MSAQRRCESCLRAKIIRTGNGTMLQCNMDKGIHLGMDFCENRVGKESIERRADEIRRFVNTVSDETLVKYMLNL